MTPTFQNPQLSLSVSSSSTTPAPTSPLKKSSPHHHNNHRQSAAPSAEMERCSSYPMLHKQRYLSSRPPLDPSLHTLHNHEYLICISDRVNNYEDYPFVGNEQTVQQILDAIYDGNSVLIVGDPGIGKRTLSLGLARQLAILRETADAPQVIHSRVVYTLSLGASFWNRDSKYDNLAEIQANIREVFKLVEAAGSEKIVFCIDDIDVLNFVDRLAKVQRRSSVHDNGVASSGNPEENRESFTSTENMLRYLLFNKKVLCLCTCIKEAYQRLVEDDTFYDEKFTNSFRVIYMPESDMFQSLRIVRAHRERVQRVYDVVILDEAVRAAVAYAKNYMTHRAMPDKALDLLYEACGLAIENGVQEEVEYSKSGGSVDRIKRNKQENAESSSSDMLVVRVVRRTFVDDLIAKWCGISGQRLNECLIKEGFFEG